LELKSLYYRHHWSSTFN